MKFKAILIPNEHIRTIQFCMRKPFAPQLPSLEIKLDCLIDDFAQKVLSQHYIISYGDHREALTDLCGILGIDVCYGRTGAGLSR